MAMSETAPQPGQHPSAVVSPLRVVLISAYELGHQPFGLASPAAWLRAEGAEVTCLDLAVEELDAAAVRAAHLVAFYLPMHTATRLAAGILPEVRELNPGAHVCMYGLYAPVNRDYLLGLGADSVIGGEFEEPLRDLTRRLASDPGIQLRLDPPLISLGRQRFLVPDRAHLPPLTQYAGLRMPDGTLKTVGYTEATRGCKHLCRHCPIVPVYGGHFRVVQRDIVLADIEQQVRAGAEHITFGDPDFFNGPGHALALVQALHDRFPELSYDVTIKVEHLVRHRHLLPVLQQTGCLLVTSAVEAFDPRILEVFDKQHTQEDFETALSALRSSGIAMNPTFVAFTPWTTPGIYTDFLATIARCGLVGNVAPVQYAIRLLIPEGSRLLELPDTHQFLGEFDPDALCYRWKHSDPRVDELQERLFAVVARAVAGEVPREDVFREVCESTAAVLPASQQSALAALAVARPADLIPHLTEPWYCCAEPLQTTTTAPPV
jgi:radical SAM superfamily enzyme YgiQ (UPF0313 family)